MAIPSAPLSGKPLASVAESERSTLYRAALSLTRQQADASDLVQDTFERALTSWPRDLGPEHVRGWLLVTLRNLFIDRRRSASRHQHVPLRDELMQSVDDHRTHRWRFVEDAALHACLDEMDARLSEVYRLHADHRLGLKAIAARLKIPTATAGTRLFRARRQLARRLVGNERQPAHEGSSNVERAKRREVSERFRSEHVAGS